jgi:hypothetical protein
MVKRNQLKRRAERSASQTISETRHAHLLDPMGTSMWCLRPDTESSMAVVRAELDEKTLEVAWAQGKAMTLQETIALALALDPGHSG